LRYTFEWNPFKARSNLRKHRISFDRAAEVVLDPLAASVFDVEHGEDEERWVTIGKDKRGSVLTLVHTFLEVSAQECRVRIISARRATKREIKQYQENQP
jgi:uncharacterized DUF497 family protein